MPTSDTESASPAPAQPDAPLVRDERLRSRFSRASLLVALALLAATFFLMSPPRGETYPGAIPWRTTSLLKPLTDLLSFGGRASTARGTEIKDLALHLAAVLGLLLFAGRLWFARDGVLQRRRLAGPWFAAQVLLAGWVALSALSALWSGDRACSFGQAGLYALALGWALGLAWTLDGRDVPRLLTGLVVVSALAGALCIWYYFERNPYHRPGFPLGNPATLAAALLPAILVCAATLAATAERLWLRRGVGPLWPTIGAVVALVPLLGCFGLTNSRAATVGLGVGVGAMLLMRAGRRLRWAIIAVMLAGLSGAGWWLNTYSRLDTAMARGATIRFRLYAWRYAAELWGQDWLSSIAGQGAGSYPRLAGQLSIRDRALDPAAFMGELVEHCHNELLEVLTEIGLVGGVTFVGGWLASLAAAAALLRQRRSQERRWLDLALLGALGAMMTESMVSPSLRLSGTPAVFYTLLGVIWASGRSASRPPAGQGVADLLADPGRLGGGRALRPLVACIAVVVCAIGGMSLTSQNWAGVLREERARLHSEEGRLVEAVGEYSAASASLLDPVRQIINDGESVYAQMALARTTYDELGMRQSVLAAQTSQPTTSIADEESGKLWWSAVQQCERAYGAAARLAERAPTLMHSAAIGASAAELLANLLTLANAPEAQEWAQRAGQAWLKQRRWRPYDVETLLALTNENYPAELGFRISLLRDALRSPPVTQDWQAALAQYADEPDFNHVLDDFLNAAGPISPETDLDSLIASGAPEVYRLKAYVEAAAGNYEEARRYAARAALLYEPMRQRFPTLHSFALAEEADFTLREAPYERADEAAELLRLAIKRLPVIQEQKYEALLRPFRSRLVVALLTAGRETEAADILRALVGEDADISSALADAYTGGLVALFAGMPPAERPALEPWIDAALKLEPAHVGAWYWRCWLAAERGDVDAVRATLAEGVRAGLERDDVRAIRYALGRTYPDLAERLRGED
ncbi:MAG: O-antigen ligase family protein [Phycisphaerae bacterium]